MGGLPAAGGTFAVCFDADSHPPIAPIAGAAVDGDLATLTAVDGTRLSAFRARSSAPGTARMLILPDVRGLYTYYEELALRFAEAGIDALAIDYFGRTAGLGTRSAEFDYPPHVAQTTWAGLRADIEAGADALRDGDPAARVFVVGFCFGGRLAFASNTLGLGLAGVIGFYGVLAAARQDIPIPIEVATQMGSPVLGLFGGADTAIPADTIAAFDRALASAGVAHDLVTYPDAPRQLLRPQGGRPRDRVERRVAAGPGVRGGELRVIATLSRRQLNRALLARQMLLERVERSVGEALEHLAPMQAQVPVDPYVALWSRLRDFDPLVLSAMVERRMAVRGTLHRATLHLATARDFLAWRPLVQPVAERGFRTGSPFGRRLVGLDMDAVLAVAAGIIDERPRTKAELRALLGPLWPSYDADAIANGVAYLLPLVQIPPRGLWGPRRQPEARAPRDVARSTARPRTRHRR